MRACVGISKMMYNLSVPLCWIESPIRSFCDAVHRSLVHIYNTGFAMEQRRLVGFPLGFGELGVPVGSEVTLSTTLASLAQANNLLEMLTIDSFSSPRCGVLLEE